MLIGSMILEYVDDILWVLEQCSIEFSLSD